MSQEYSPNEKLFGDMLINLAEVTELTGLSRATLYRWMDAGRFPSQLILGPNTVRWKLSEIRAWLDNLIPVNEYDMPVQPPAPAVLTQPNLSPPSAPKSPAQSPRATPPETHGAITEADGRRSVLPLSLPPRGLSRVVAAAYIGVPPALFDELVSDGRMPKPKVINSINVWDRLRIDAAFEALPENEVRRYSVQRPRT